MKNKKRPNTIVLRALLVFAPCLMIGCDPYFSGHNMGFPFEVPVEYTPCHNQEIVVPGDTYTLLSGTQVQWDSVLCLFTNITVNYRNETHPIHVFNNGGINGSGPLLDTIAPSVYFIRWPFQTQMNLGMSVEGGEQPITLQQVHATLGVDSFVNHRNNIDLFWANPLKVGNNAMYNNIQQGYTFQWYFGKYLNNKTWKPFQIKIASDEFRCNPYFAACIPILAGDSLRCRANLNSMFGDYDFSQFAINEGKSADEKNALLGIIRNQQNPLLECFKFAPR
jgi:hypothetical protein